MRQFRPGHLMAIAGVAGSLWMAWTASTGPESDRADAALLRPDAPFPRRLGTTTVPRRPQRVVAASVLSAEVLLAIAPWPQLAGVLGLAADARYCNQAVAAATLPLVGAEPEQLIAVHPDLVVLDEFTRAEVTDLLATVGVPALRTGAVRDFADVVANVRRIGWATGCDAAAAGVIDAMQAQMAALRAGAPAVADWRVMNLNGDLDTYGARSLLDAAVRLAGARHLPAEQGVGGYRKLDIETVLAWRPDALLIGVEPGQDDALAAWLEHYPGLGLLPCVQRGRIVRLPNALLGSTSHLAVEVAERIQSQLRAWGHP